MNHHIIGMDIDGVLADFNTAYVDLVERHTGVRLELPPKTWDYAKAAGVDDSAVWAEIAQGAFWRDLPILPGACDVIARLNSLPNVYYITTRPGHWAKAQSEYWLINHGADCPTVIVSKDKGAIAQGLGLTVMVDDKPENLDAVMNGCWDGNFDDPMNIMLRAPYNERVVNEFYVTRVIDSVVELLEMEEFTHASN